MIKRILMPTALIAAQLLMVAQAHAWSAPFDRESQARDERICGNLDVLAQVKTQSEKLSKQVNSDSRTKGMAYLQSLNQQAIQELTQELLRAQKADKESQFATALANCRNHEMGAQLLERMQKTSAVAPILAKRVEQELKSKASTLDKINLSMLSAGLVGVLAFAIAIASIATGGLAAIIIAVVASLFMTVGGAAEIYQRYDGYSTKSVSAEEAAKINETARIAADTIVSQPETQNLLP